MTEEHHPTYPSAVQALLLIALLIAIELFVAAAVFDANLLAGVNDGDVYGFITVVGNGILFVGLMAYKRIGYRALFHPAGHSVTATMTLVSVPILMLVPALVMVAGAGNTIVQWLVPMDADDMARFEEQMAPGIVPILFSCVAAPVLEEMLFRGVILRGFLRQYSRTFAILWSATLVRHRASQPVPDDDRARDRHRRRLAVRAVQIACGRASCCTRRTTHSSPATTRGSSITRRRRPRDSAPRSRAGRSSPPLSAV